MEFTFTSDQNVKEIEKIYYNFEKLCDDYVELPETEKAKKEFWEYLYIHNLIGNAGSSHKLPLDELINEISAANEKQGFIYGFSYAVKLMKEGVVRNE